MTEAAPREIRRVEWVHNGETVVAEVGRRITCDKPIRRNGKIDYTRTPTHRVCAETVTGITERETWYEITTDGASPREWENPLMAGKGFGARCDVTHDGPLR